jgi:hypothetical protein
MAARTQTYETTDWQIWTYVPLAGSFVLDFSMLNGSDTLGATDGSIVVQDVQITSLVINEGSPVSQGIFPEITPASMSCNLIVSNFTSSVSKNYLIGTPIWVTLKNAETYDDTVYGKNTPYFMGRIRSFNVQVTPGSNIASIDLEATSQTQDDLNVLMTILKDNSVYKTAAISAAADALGIPTLYKDSYNHFGGTALGAYETKSYGDYLADMVLCDLNVVRDDVTPVDVVVGATSRTFIYNTGVKTTHFGISTLPLIYTYDDDSISNMTMDWDGAGSPTGVTLTNYFDSNIVYQYGSTSSDASGGAVIYVGTVDLLDLTEMKGFADLALFYNKTFAPISITTVTARNFQDLTFREDTVYTSGFSPVSAWLYPENLLRVGDHLQVNMPTYGFTNYDAIVVGRSIEVSNDFVLTTYNLWKGY